MKKKYFLPALFLLFLFILHEIVPALGKSRASAAETGTLVVTAQDTDGKQIDAPIEVKGEKKGKGTLALALPKKKYTVLFGKMKGYTLKTPKTGRQIASVEPGKTTIVAGIYESEAQPGMVRVKKGSQDFYIDEYEYPNKASREPTVKVDWSLAKALCSDLGKRLCSREEWSAACGGPKGYTYPYGRIYDGSKCNGADADKGVAAQAGAMKGCVSEYGAFDMSGNVWEWVGTSESGVGLMGGNWSSLEGAMACGNVEPELDLAYKDETIGFRCCKTAPKVEAEDKTPPVTAASPGGGTYTSAQSVTLSCSDTGGSGCAATWYTTDGSAPTNHSSRYSSPITISSTTTLKFLSMDKVENIESVKTEKYTISIAPKDATPPATTASPGGGTYNSARKITLSCKDNAGGSGCAATYYKTDGSDPTASSSVYSSPIAISKDTTLKFFSKDKAGNAESVNTEKYTISASTTDTTAPAGMVFVKGGCFDMGDTLNDNEYADEKPVHQVCLSDYYMDKTEVTQGAYQKEMGTNPSYFKSGDNYPVEQVSWYDARDYCQAVGKRLPTEAEWEYAAREGGKKVRFGTGKDTIGSDEANFDATYVYSYSRKGSNRAQTTPVGGFSPNALGLYDMSGNVWEWAADWYGVNYYSQSVVNNPTGPSSGTDRVLRGGSWIGSASDTRASFRDGGDPDDAIYIFGFRCAQ